MKLLRDKIAIVTGASSGIGKSIAIAFAREGATAILASRNREKLDAVAAGIAADGGAAHVAVTDVTDEAQVTTLFRDTQEQFGRLDILVNNAGIAEGGHPDKISLDSWQRVVDVNLTAPFLCSREAFKIMKPQRSGRIINIGSVSAKVPRPQSAPYTSTKFGLEGLTRSLALDGREFGIAASVIQPGNTQSSIWEGRESIADQEGIMSADDLARVVVTMASLPPEMNVLESVVLPVSMPFVGRG
jgi:NAD(P)-dependent dehydrogenase (short-subunit alcohol dehydrogenase family)